MEEDFLDLAESAGAQRCVVVTDPATGLRAFIVIDDTTLGRAVGGVRTARYPDARSALEDAAALAKAMTLKCAIAGLASGGGKIVVMDHPALDRRRAFERLGSRIEELGGLLHTSSDLGTNQADVDAMAMKTSHVSTDLNRIAESVARGLVHCLEACIDSRSRTLPGLNIAIQGCGAVGRAVGRALKDRGAKLLLSDLDLELARATARELGAEVCSASGILLTDVDVVVPCATGATVDEESAQKMTAWAVCGSANNALASLEVAHTLARRGILHVPDTLASAGGVIEGLHGRDTEMVSELLGGLATTTSKILRRAEQNGDLPIQVVEEMARQRITDAAAGS